MILIFDMTLILAQSIFSQNVLYIHCKKKPVKKEIFHKKQKTEIYIIFYCKIMGYKDIY